MQNPHLILSRNISAFTIVHQVPTHSQHLRRSCHVVAGSFYRDWYLDGLFIYILLLFFFPNQLPASTKISLLPRKIALFSIIALEGLPTQVLTKEQPKRITIGAYLGSDIFPILQLRKRPSHRTHPILIWSYSTQPLCK